MPARRGAWAIYDVFDTADGEQLFIGVTSDQQWARFVEEFGLTNWPPTRASRPTSRAASERPG